MAGRVQLPAGGSAAHGGDPADAFDVIVPTLPGFAWSTPVTRGDLNYWKIADIVHQLMTDVLGYDRYGSLGSDYGALVNSALGHKYDDSIIALHHGHDLPPGMFQHDRFWGLTAGAPVPADASLELRAGILKLQATYASHVAVHMLDASTLTHGLNDSPIGMLAWLLPRWKKWGDRKNDFDAGFSRDFILARATVFWGTQSIGTSIRMYRDTVRPPGHRCTIAAPWSNRRPASPFCSATSTRQASPQSRNASSPSRTAPPAPRST